MVFHPRAMTNATRTLAKDVLHCGLFGVMETRKAEDLSGGPLYHRDYGGEEGGIGGLLVQCLCMRHKGCFSGKSGKVGD